MAVSIAVLSMVRVLAIIHIVVGALLIIFGIVDGVTAVPGTGDMFFAGDDFYGVWIGTWVSVHCRNASFVKYNFASFPPSPLFCFLAFPPARSSRYKETT